MVYSDVPQDHWAYSNIVWAKRLYIMEGYPDGTFLPNGTVTRAETATVAVRTVRATLVVTLAGALAYKVLFGRKKS